MDGWMDGWTDGRTGGRVCIHDIVYFLTACMHWMLTARHAVITACMTWADQGFWKRDVFN